MPPFSPGDLYGITWPGECDISPDGDSIAFVATRMDRETDAYKSAIWLVPADGSCAPRQFTAGAKRDSSPRFSPDGRRLAFLSERGDEKPQLYVMPFDGGEARALTNLPFGAGVPEWAPDGSRIAFSAPTGTPADPDPKKAKPFRRITAVKYKMNGQGFTYDRRRHLFVVPLDGGEPAQVTEGDWDDTQPAWSPDGTELAFISEREPECRLDSINDLYVVNVASREVRKLTETKGACAAPSWSPDGNAVAHLHNPDWPANPNLRLADAGGGGLRYVDPSFDRHMGAGALPGAVAKPVWLPGGGILSVAEDRGARKLVVAPAAGPSRFVGSETATLAWYSVAADGRAVAAIRSTIGSPGEVVAIDLESGAERQLTNLNPHLGAAVALSGAERFTLSPAPGVELDCWIMKPAGFEEAKRYPVLLNVHGGPFTQYSESFMDEFQVYTGAGYGVVFCNPRGSSGQSTEFGRALIGNLGGPDYDDVMAAFEAALARMPWADQSRLGVMGGSYGGFMTSWIIGHTDRFRAAVSERAVNDWYTMQGTSDIGATFNRHYLGHDATIQGDVNAVLRQSPLTYIKHCTTPVLILHSEDDLRCPISQAEQMWVVLQQMGKEAEFVRVPDETHELTRSGRPSHRVARFEVILDWFSRKL